MGYVSVLFREWECVDVKANVELWDEVHASSMSPLGNYVYLTNNDTNEHACIENKVYKLTTTFNIHFYTFHWKNA